VSKSKGKKEPIALVTPESLKDPKKRAAFIDKMADKVVDLIAAERKRLGLPPMKP
jgi:hypothetical protein